VSEPAIKPLVLIDGSNWLYRAFHALPPLANPQGQPTGAVYGLGNMLRRLYKDYSPQRIAVVFDPRGKTFRHEIYAEYKATRDSTPEDLSIQFPAIRELLEAMAMPVLQIDGIEADDVIGTLAMKAVAAGEEVVIVTGDKDLAQLVSPQIKLLDTMKNRTLDREAVIERFGVPPECIVDYLALVGDTSDNIPGVPGCGPKTAAKWLNEYGSLDALVAHADEIKGKIGEKLRAALNVLPLSHDLATIRTDIPLPLELDALQPGKADDAKLAEFYQRMGFTRWLEELGGRGGAVPVPEPVASAAAPVDYRMVATREQLRELCEALAGAELICFDTETDALDAMRAGLVGLSFATKPGEAWYVPLMHDYLGAPEQLPLGEVVAAVKPMLEDPGKPKLGQHLKYDVNVLARYGIEVAGIGYDTMLDSYVLDAANWRHDMDSMAQQHLGHKTISFTDVAGKGKGQLTFNQVALDKATEYAAEDADITLRLHQALYPQLQKIGSLPSVFHDIEMPLVPVLARMERAGVKIDTALLARISAEFGDRMNELQAQAWKAADTEFNLGSPAQLQTILYDKLQLPVLGRTPKGQPSTAEDVLDQLANEHELPRLILEWRGMSKLRGTYTDALPKQINPATGRIHTSYHQAVAATGRLSSSDPNLQNIPIRNLEGRRIRQAFIAEDGQRLLSIDYSQIELRLMAHLSADERLRDAFRKGQDVHQATAAEVFGLALDAVEPDQRRAAKAINFGLIYGMSAFGLARQLGIARGDAQRYIDTFFARYPGVKRYMDESRAQAREQGYVETLFGRRLYLPNIRSRNQGLRQYAERTAINAPLQGTAADLIKLTMIDIDGWLAREQLPLKMIMQVHDELVFEGPAAAIATHAEAIAQRMCQVHALSVPLVADWGTGLNWDEAHDAQGHASSPSKTE